LSVAFKQWYPKESFLNALALIEAVLQAPEERSARVEALPKTHDARTLAGAQVALAEGGESLESVLALWISEGKVGGLDVLAFSKRCVNESYGRSSSIGCGAGAEPTGVGRRAGAPSHALIAWW
jgi:hypothetical protein